MAIVHYINKSRAEIYDKVQMQSHYVGTKGEAFEQIAITDENKELLDQFLADGVPAMDEILKHYIKITNVSDGYNRVLELPDNWDQSVANSLTESVMQYLVNYIISRWMRVVQLSTEAELVFLNYAEDCKKHVYRLLFHRTSPKRRVFKHKFEYKVVVADKNYSESDYNYSFEIRSREEDLDWDGFKLSSCYYVAGYINAEGNNVPCNIGKSAIVIMPYDKNYKGVYIEVFDSLANANNRMLHDTIEGRVASAEYTAVDTVDPDVTPTPTPTPTPGEPQPGPSINL